MTDGRLTRQSNEDALALSQQTTAFLKKHKLEEPLLPIPIPLLSPSDSIDHWMMCEKLFLAALRVGDDKAAFECLQRLIQRFGASDERVMGLRGLYQESVAVDEKALNKVLKEYQDILTEDPVNIVRGVHVILRLLLITEPRLFGNVAWHFSRASQGWQKLLRLWQIC